MGDPFFFSLPVRTHLLIKRLFNPQSASNMWYNNACLKKYAA